MSFVVPDYNCRELLQRHATSGGLTLIVTAVCAAALTAGLKVANERLKVLPPVITLIHRVTLPVEIFKPMTKSGPVDHPIIQAPPIEIQIPQTIDHKSDPVATMAGDTKSTSLTDIGLLVLNPIKTADPVIITAGIDPKYRAAMQPPYPASATRLEQEGRLLLRVHVASDGHVMEALVTSSSGYSSLDDAAKNHAIKHWHLRPATQDGTAIESWLTVPVQFHLDKG